MKTYGKFDTKSYELPFPEEMLTQFAKPGCPKCHSQGFIKAITPLRIVHSACKCALMRIAQRAKKLNKYADMLNPQEN